jgi:hypothetical protein
MKTSPKEIMKSFISMHKDVTRISDSIIKNRPKTNSSKKLDLLLELDTMKKAETTIEDEDAEIGLFREYILGKFKYFL